MNLKRIIGIVVVIILLVSGAASAALYKVGDRVFDEMIEQAMLPDALTEAIPTEIPEKQNNDTILTPPANIETTNTADQQKQEPTPTSTPKLTPTPSAPVVIPTTEQPSAEPSKQPVQSIGEEVNSLQIPKQKIEEIKEDVTAADKMTIAALAFRKLKQQDISELAKMAAGGITSDEKEKMKKLAFERFTEEEIKEIKEMYNKYMN